MGEWPIASDLNRDGVVDSVDLGIFCEQWLATLPLPEPVVEDASPPEPDPAEWAQGGEPREVWEGVGAWDYWAHMEAAEATDSSGSVEYLFECIDDPRFSSGWQSSRTYGVHVGRGGQHLQFRVKTRDLYGNETAWSETLAATETPARR
jgi:hypothetical protein